LQLALVGALCGCRRVVGCESVMFLMACLVFASGVLSLCEATLPFDWGWVGVFVHGCAWLRMRFVRGCVCCFDVVETSYEGHMVDALASRADEGRWSLR
jgi:hypothetical protein